MIKPQSSVQTSSHSWTRSIICPEEFEREQGWLASVWTFVGFSSDLAKDGDWFQATIATRPVFIQRFGSELRGFENVCRHRFHPLRSGERGNGPIICPFHGWQYNSAGRAVGIPLCRELYGTTPDKLGIHLTRLEVATCGDLIFGRFAGSSARDTLEEFLGEGFSVLQAMTAPVAKRRFTTRTAAANWKLCVHITHDDYHAPLVHSTTLGKYGYVRPKDITYTRFGFHSAFIYGAEPDIFDRMVQACKEGSFRPSTYSIFQIFPNFLVVLLFAGPLSWQCSIQQYVPVTHDRSIFRAWSYPSPFDANQKWKKYISRLAEPISSRIFKHYMCKVALEDLHVCESLQDSVRFIKDLPRFSVLEERIGWFEEAYRQLVPPKE